MEPKRNPFSRLPPWLARLLLVLSVLPFALFGAFLITKFWRLTGGQAKIAIPFAAFVAFFCGLPIVQIWITLRKMNSPTAVAGQPPRQWQCENRDTPAGREFLFPAKPQPGAAWIIATLVILWVAAIWALYYMREPMALTALVFNAGWITVVALTWFWFCETRVAINATHVTSKIRVLFLAKTNSLDTSEIRQFEAAPARKIGRVQYYKIQAVRISKNTIAVADGIPGEAEARQIAGEMTHALARPA